MKVMGADDRKTEATRKNPPIPGFPKALSFLFLRVAPLRHFTENRILDGLLPGVDDLRLHSVEDAIDFYLRNDPLNSP